MRNAAGTRMMVVGTYRDADVEEGSTLAEVTLDLKRAARTSASSSAGSTTTRPRRC